MTETSPVRVLIADDHPMFRFGLAAAIGAAPGWGAIRPPRRRVHPRA